MKRNKKAIIVAALVFVAAILLIAYGIWGGKLQEKFSKKSDDFYPSRITDENIGEKINLSFNGGDIDYSILDIKDLYLYITEDPDADYEAEDYAAYWYGLDVSNLGGTDKTLIKHSVTEADYVQVNATIRKYDASVENTIRSELTVWLEDYYVMIQDYFEEDVFQGVTLEMFVEEEISYLTPYYLEITDVVVTKAFDGIPYIVAGAIIAFVALLFLICFVFNLKKRKVIPAVLAVPVVILIVASIVLFNHLRTIASIDEVGLGMYTMKNYECTDTDELIDANISSIDEFIEWAVKNHYFNLPVSVNQENFGCAAFAATTPEGDHLFGRNFDYYTTDTLFIYSHPEGKYASIGCADMAFVNVGLGSSMSADSILGKGYMMVLPYAVMDGMNEKGLGVSILELTMDEVHEDTGKQPLLVFLAMRAVLDNCASVEEAIQYLDGFDIHTGLGNSYHLMLVDKSGDYAVLEWLDGEMCVTRVPAVTNSVVAPGEHYNEGSVDGRLDAIVEALGDDRVVTEEEAMGVLGIASSMTSLNEWSCVYNLDNFTVNVCLDTDYETVYTFKASDFE